MINTNGLCTEPKEKYHIDKHVLSIVPPFNREDGSFIINVRISLFPTLASHSLKRSGIA